MTTEQMRTHELFTMTPVKDMSDCTTIYECSTLKPFTVNDLISAVLQNTREWGEIMIGDTIFTSNKLEYRYGRIVKDNINPQNLDKKVTRVRANGGWSKMDYLISTE